MDFETFGKDWQKEVMKMRKKEIVCFCQKIGQTREEAIEHLESIANFMRGMCLDPAVPQGIKIALTERVKKIDSFTNK